MDFGVQIKPTSHKTRCGLCGENIQKGDLKFFMKYHGFRDSGSLSFHLSCLLDYLKAIEAMAQREKDPDRFRKAISLYHRMVWPNRTKELLKD